MALNKIQIRFLQSLYKNYVFVNIIQQVLSHHQMQSNQSLKSPKNSDIGKVETATQQNDLSFRWATHIQFNQQQSFKYFYLTNLIKTNFTSFSNCLIYVRDSRQAESFKSHIEKQTKVAVKCCNIFDLLDTIKMDLQIKIYIAYIGNYYLDKFNVPENIDFIINMAISTQLRVYEKCVQKNINPEAKIIRYGVVINYCSYQYEKKTVSEFIQKKIPKIDTFESVSQQKYDLSKYFKLEYCKQPDLRNLKWATYLVILTDQNLKAGRTFNYINKNSQKFTSCIVYCQTEGRAKFILSRLAQQIKNKTFITNYLTNCVEQLKKLQKNELRVLIVVTHKQETEKEAEKFYVPRNVDMIITDSLPSQPDLWKRRFSKNQVCDKRGVILCMFTTFEECEQFKTLCKENEMIINNQHRKDDYEPTKYLKIQTLHSPRANKNQLTSSNSPKQINVGNIAPQKLLNQQKIKIEMVESEINPPSSQKLINKQEKYELNIIKSSINQKKIEEVKVQENLQLQDKLTSTKTQNEGIKSVHTSESDSVQAKGEKKQQKQQDVQVVDKNDQAQPTSDMYDETDQFHFGSSTEKEKKQTQPQTDKNKLDNISTKMQNNNKFFKSAIQAPSEALQVDSPLSNQFKQEASNSNSSLPQEGKEKLTTSVPPLSHTEKIYEYKALKNNNNTQVQQQSGQISRKTETDQISQTKTQKKIQGQIEITKTEQADGKKSHVIDPILETNKSQGDTSFIKDAPKAMEEEKPPNPIPQQTRNQDQNQDEKTNLLKNLSAKQEDIQENLATFPRKGEENYNSLSEKNQGKNLHLNEAMTTNTQTVVDSISNSMNNLEHAIASSLQKQQKQLENTRSDITKCMREENSKSAEQLRQIKQDTVLLQGISTETKLVREGLAPVASSIQQLKSDLKQDLKQLPRKIEENYNSLSERLSSITNSIQGKNRHLNEAMTTNTQTVVDSISNSMNNLEHAIASSLQKQQKQLENTRSDITKCMREENSKSAEQLRQIKQDTLLLQGISTETKLVREGLAPVASSIQQLKSDLKQDLKQLSNGTLSVEAKLKQGTNLLGSKISQTNKSTNFLIKEAAEKQEAANKMLKNLTQKQQQFYIKFDQVPGKLQHIYIGVAQKIQQIEKGLGQKTQVLQGKLKEQSVSQTNQILAKVTEQSENSLRLIKIENKQILNYIDKEKERKTKDDGQTLQKLQAKKSAFENYQKQRTQQFERQLNEKKTTQSGAALQKTIAQLQRKYKQSLTEVESLRTYKVNGIQTSNQLNKVKQELAEAKKTETKFTQYKQKYEKNVDQLAKNYSLKDKQCKELLDELTAYKQQQKDYTAIRDELYAAKQLIYSLIQKQPEKKDPQTVKQMMANNLVSQNTLVKLMNNSTIPKQAQNMTLPALIKTYLIAETNVINDLKPTLTNLIKGIPPKQSLNNLLIDSRQGKECRDSILNSLKTLNKQSGSHLLLNNLLRLMGEYDNLKKYQISIMKYCRDLQDTMKTLNEKTEQAAKKGAQCSVPKIFDHNQKESSVNNDLQKISDNVNRLVSNLVSKKIQLGKANKQIEEFKKANNSQSTIITSLNADKKSLGQRLTKAVNQISQLQAQRTQIQGQLSGAEQKLKKTIIQLNSTKETLTKTATELKNKTDLLQQATANLFKTENSRKLLATELETTKGTLKEKQKQNLAQKEQLKAKDDQISKQKRAYQDLLRRTSDQADEANRKYQDLKQTAEKRIIEANKKYSELQQKSKAQLIDQQNQRKELEKIKNNQINEIKSENTKERESLYKKMQKFEEFLNKSIKNTLNYESNVSINNYQERFAQFQKAMIERQSKSKFLVESSTYRGMSEDDKKFVFNTIKRVVNRKIDYTKTLFEGWQGVNFNEWLCKIYDKPNLLVLITLSNGQLIGGFSENPFSRQRSNRGKGYMMSITNKRIYDIKSRHEGKVAKYDDFMFIFGNNELLIKTNLTFTAIFAKQFCFFETGDDSIKDFLGQDEDEGSFKSVEFHQVIFS